MATTPVLSLVTPVQQSPAPVKKPGKASPWIGKAEIESQPPGSKLPAGRRMYLYTSLKGLRAWKWKYRLFDPATNEDRTYEVKLGTYPDISHQDADAERAKAWSGYVKNGVHPPQYRVEKAKVKAAKVQAALAESNADTVWKVAAAWIALKRSKWSPAYALQIETYLRRYCGPDTAFGARPVAAVSTPEVSDLIESIGKATPAVAKLVRQWLRAVFRRAKGKGLCTGNPVNDFDLSDAVTIPATVNSPNLSTGELRTLLHAIQGYSGDARARLLLLLLAHTCVRSSELRCASWDEFDLPGAVWRIPASRMKMKREHRVPLTKQVLALLDELQQLAGNKGLLFKNERDPLRPMPQSSAREAVYRLTAKEFTPHGFRATFSTQANEADYEPRYVDAVLAHAKKGKVEASYNKATHYEKRVWLMREWSVFLDALVVGPVRCAK